MSELYEREISSTARPKPEDVAFDLNRALSSVVSLRSRIPEDAFTAATLGVERGGNGVLIREDGLVVTVGYLIIEAETVWLIDNEGNLTPAHVVAYDQETGFGLVQALGPMNLPTMEMGNSSELKEGDRVIVAGHGGRRQSVKAHVVSKREFAGYWEYVLDEGIFTSPPHPNWGGTALIGGDGTLCGIGSLFIQQAVPGQDPIDGNMIVPIDILKPILDDLLMYGRTNRPPRPWLGMMTAEAEDQLVVAGLTSDGPAQQAGLLVGDLVLEVDGRPVEGLATMFRRIWAIGEAGVEVPLTLLRDGDTMEVSVASANRYDYLKSPRLH